MSTRNDIMQNVIDRIHTIKDDPSYDAVITSIEEYRQDFLTMPKDQLPLLMVVDQHNDQVSVMDGTNTRYAVDIVVWGVVAEGSWDLCRQQLNEITAGLRQWVNSGPSLGDNVLAVQWVECQGLSIDPGDAGTDYTGVVRNELRLIYWCENGVY